MGARITALEMAPDQFHRWKNQMYPHDIIIEEKDSRINLNQVWKPQIYAENLLAAYNVFQTAMHTFFRYPIYLRRNPDDGSYVLKFKMVSFFPLAYAVSSFFIILITVVYTCNVLGVLLNFPSKTDYNYTYILPTADAQLQLYSFKPYEIRAHEMYFIHRNLVPVVIILSNLLHSSIASWCIFTRRYKIAAYFTYWLSAVETMKIQAGYKMREYMLKLIFVYFAFLLTLVVLEICKVSALISGASGITASVIMRLIKDDVHLSEHFWLYKTVFGFVLLYVLLASKCFMFLFILTCKFLRNSLSVWTARMDYAINADGAFLNRPTKHKHRLGFDHLFKDFVCILELLDEGDNVFAYTLETFYAAHINSLIFELFFIYQVLTAKSGFEGQRFYDVYVMGIYACQTIAIMYIVTMSATDVSQKLLDGLDIIRHRAVIRSRLDEEIYFVYSIYFSYIGTAQHGISGANMILINRPFIVGTLILFATFLIIVFQFEPLLYMTDRVQLDRIEASLTLPWLADLLEGFHAINKLETTYSKT